MITLNGRAEHDSELMKGAGYALSVLAALVAENEYRKTVTDAGSEYLNGYLLGGIMESIKLIGTALCVAGEALEEQVEERKTLAERQLRKGSDSRKGEVGEQCGRG
ncbi:TPA: hypothetical protein ACGWUX_004707 [Pseudomonas aeruginosa]